MECEEGQFDDAEEDLSLLHPPQPQTEYKETHIPIQTHHKKPDNPPINTPENFQLPSSFLPPVRRVIHQLDDVALVNLLSPQKNYPTDLPKVQKALEKTSPKSAQEIEQLLFDWIVSVCGKEEHFSSVRLSDYPGMGIGEHIQIADPTDMYEFVANTLACFLMIEDADPHSFYRPYLDLLPRTFSTPMWWTIHQYNELQGAALDKSLKQKQVMVYTFLEKIQGCFNEVISDPDLLSKCTFEEYSWALSVLWSRSYMIKYVTAACQRGRESMQIYLAPLADMLNHKEKEKGAMCDYASFQLNENNRFQIISNVRHPQDRQVFISYGDRSNLEFLVSYGFMPPMKKDAHETKLIIPSVQLECGQALWESKKELIKAVLGSNDVSHIQVVAGQGVPSTLEKVMRICALSVSDIASHRQKQLILENLLLNKRISLANERTATRFALITCDYTLASYETTLSEDLSAFNSGLLEKDKPAYLAYRLRILDKKIITSIKEHFLKAQKVLNEERHQKFAARNTDPSNILNALSNLGLEELLCHFQNQPGPISSSSSSEEVQGEMTFIPPEIRNQGLEFSSNSDSEGIEE